MSMDFTHQGYHELLRSLLDMGYQVRGYDDAAADQQHLILRHDIDMSLQASEPVAEIENELNVKAWYFVLLRTDMYNAFSAASLKSLKRLRELGHEIGLHLDASLYASDSAALDAAAIQECRILEDMSGAPVRSISFHRPAKALLGLDRQLAGRPHAYEPRFFQEMGYCSDSRGAWHHGHPLEHEAVQQNHALQLLTHPIWWSPEKAEPVQSRLDQFVQHRHELLRQELARNCSAYDPKKFV